MLLTISPIRQNNTAINIEDEFEAPQDIEGGITIGEDNNADDAQIYIWQTRNIVE